MTIQRRCPSVGSTSSWVYEYVLAAMRNVVGVLAGLNRVYVAPDKLKRAGTVVSRMELTPPNAAARYSE